MKLGVGISLREYPTRVRVRSTRCSSSHTVTSHSADNHGRRNSFESGTAEGVEHESPKASRGYPHPIKGVCGTFCLEIYVRIGAFWSANQS